MSSLLYIVPFDKAKGGMIAPKSLFGQKRKRMTLIAAIPCKKGFVLAADTQETVPMFDGQNWADYRKTVQKVTPCSMGAFSVVVAGSGNASLIDSFIPILERKLASETGDSLQDFVRYTEEALASFYRIDVALCPDADKSLKMFFAAVPHRGGECGVWLQSNVRITPIADAQLVGWEEPLYVNVVKRLCGTDMSLSQGILAAVYTLTVAEQTSNCVRGPMAVTIVKENGIWMEDHDYISTLTARLATYERQLNEIFLACADTSIHGFQLREKIEAFSQGAVELHKQQINESLRGVGLAGIFSTNDPYPKLPPGGIVHFGTSGLTFEHDEEKLRTQRERFEQGREQLDRLLKEREDLNLPATSVGRATS
jgi:hypothetical protein